MLRLLGVGVGVGGGGAGGPDCHSKVVVVVYLLANTVLTAMQFMWGLRLAKHIGEMVSGKAHAE
jgi:hypothetical protein